MTLSIIFFYKSKLNEQIEVAVKVIIHALLKGVDKIYVLLFAVKTNRVSISIVDYSDYL